MKTYKEAKELPTIYRCELCESNFNIKTLQAEHAGNYKRLRKHWLVRLAVKLGIIKLEEM